MRHGQMEVRLRNLWDDGDTRGLTDKNHPRNLRCSHAHGTCESGFVLSIMYSTKKPVDRAQKTDMTERLQN